MPLNLQTIGIDVAPEVWWTNPELSNRDAGVQSQPIYLADQADTGLGQDLQHVPDIGNSKANEAHSRTTVTRDLTAKYAHMMHIRVEGTSEFVGVSKTNGMAYFNGGQKVFNGDVTVDSGKIVMDGTGIDINSGGLTVADTVNTVIGNGDVTIGGSDSDGTTLMYNTFQANKDNVKLSSVNGTAGLEITETALNVTNRTLFVDNTANDIIMRVDPTKLHMTTDGMTVKGNSVALNADELLIAPRAFADQGVNINGSHVKSVLLSGHSTSKMSVTGTNISTLSLTGDGSDFTLDAGSTGKISLNAEHMTINENGVRHKVWSDNKSSELMLNGTHFSVTTNDNLQKMELSQDNLILKHTHVPDGGGSNVGIMFKSNEEKFDIVSENTDASTILLDVANTAKFNHITATGTLKISGSTNIEGKLTVNGVSEFNSDMTFNADNLSTNGTFVVKTANKSKELLKVTNDGQLTKIDTTNLTINSNLALDGATHSIQGTQTTFLNGDGTTLMTIAGEKVTMNQNLEVAGNTSLGNNSNLDTIDISGTTTIQGNTKILNANSEWLLNLDYNNDKITVGKELQVNGQSTFKNDFKVTNDAGYEYLKVNTQSGTMTVNGTSHSVEASDKIDITATNAVNITGTNVNTSGILSHTGDATVSGSMTVDGHLSVGKNFVVQGDTVYIHTSTLAVEDSTIEINRQNSETIADSTKVHVLSTIIIIDLGEGAEWNLSNEFCRVSGWFGDDDSTSVEDVFKCEQFQPATNGDNSTSVGALNTYKGEASTELQALIDDVISTMNVATIATPYFASRLVFIKHDGDAATALGSAFPTDRTVTVSNIKENADESGIMFSYVNNNGDQPFSRKNVKLVYRHQSGVHGVGQWCSNVGMCVDERMDMLSDVYMHGTVRMDSTVYMNGSVETNNQVTVKDGLLINNTKGNANESVIDFQGSSGEKWSIGCTSVGDSFMLMHNGQSIMVWDSTVA